MKKLCAITPRAGCNGHGATFLRIRVAGYAGKLEEKKSAIVRASHIKAVRGSGLGWVRELARMGVVRSAEVGWTWTYLRDILS